MTISASSTFEQQYRQSMRIQRQKELLLGARNYYAEKTSHRHCDVISYAYSYVTSLCNDGFNSDVSEWKKLNSSLHLFFSYHFLSYSQWSPYKRKNFGKNCQHIQFFVGYLLIFRNFVVFYENLFCFYVGLLAVFSTFFQVTCPLYRHIDDCDPYWQKNIELISECWKFH